MVITLLVHGQSYRRLKNKDLAAARDRLVEKMAEYQGYTGLQSDHCI